MILVCMYNYLDETPPSSWDGLAEMTLVNGAGLVDFIGRIIPAWHLR
jgi:hypothetical protein